MAFVMQAQFSDDDVTECHQYIYKLLSSYYSDYIAMYVTFLHLRLKEFISIHNYKSCILHSLNVHKCTFRCSTEK